MGAKDPFTSQNRTENIEILLSSDNVALQIVAIIAFCHTQIVVKATLAGEVLIHNGLELTNEVGLVVDDRRRHPLK